MAERKLRVCIVGTGARGAAHAKGWLESGDAEVASVVDIDEARAREMAQAFGVAATFADFKEAVQRDDVDVVSVCTPAFYHQAIAVFALEHGKHVLCEKPLALRPEQADRIVAAVDRAGTVFAVNFQSRFGDAPTAVRRLYREGALGAPVLFRWHTAAELRPKRAMHDLERGNGGPVVDTCIHYFDYWRWVTGTDPVRVTAHVRTLARNRPEVAQFAMLAPDTASITVEYGSGDLGAITISWGLPPGCRAPQGIEDALGPKGVLAPMRPRAGFTVYGENKATREFGPYATDPQLTLTQHVIRAIRHGEPVQATARDGRIALLTAWAALESAEAVGQPVAVKG
jgi:predicted dehydrogenase